MRCLILIYCLIAYVCGAPKSEELFELSVVHLNDFHARFEEISPNSSPCKDTNCIGGFSRVYTKVNELINERPNSIFLNAGDNFQGTLWYNVFRWNVTQYFLNKLPTDAYTLGNHEFDNKISGVVPFIKLLNAPTLVANIDDSLEPDIQGIYQKSTIIERSGRKIGIIGVIAKNTNELSSTENLKFTDELTAINKEAEKLVTENNCNIIIVLSHCGLEVDKKIASEVHPHVNLIVGGHSHSFLYSGTPPGPDKPVGTYPVVVERENGRKVLVVQASAYTKYLGNLSVWYNQNGDLVKWDGKPIYLDKNVPQDPEINKELNVWKQKVDEYGQRIIGTTNVVLSKENSHGGESNLGNFMTDAMVDYYTSESEQNSWTYSSIGIMNSGGIRTTLTKGNITYNDLITASPFESTIDVGELTGSQIKAVLEYSVNDKLYDASFVQFLQFSGMRVVFDLKKDVGSRVVSIQIKCRTCDIPRFEAINFNGVYRIAMPSFIAKGGDGYSIIRDNLKNRKIGPVDSEVFEAYAKKISPITTSLDGRIKFLD